MDKLKVVLKYFAAVIEDGDYLNDWLTHMPVEWVYTIRELGEIVAVAMGYN